VNIRGVQAFLEPSLVCEPLETEKHTMFSFQNHDS